MPDITIEEVLCEIFTDIKKIVNYIGNIPISKQIPESKLRLYGILSPFKTIFFNTKEELIEFKKNNNIAFAKTITLDYIGELYQQKDVIKITDQYGDSWYYTKLDINSYAVYEEEQSNILKTPIWTNYQGNLTEIYKFLEYYGITLEKNSSPKKYTLTK